MDFVDKIKELTNKIEFCRESIKTEEGTKIAIIQPFFRDILGYAVDDPNEFEAEFSADDGFTKSEKVDYAIKKDGKPSIIVECKCLGENLKNYRSQLFKYFGAIIPQYAILTNGVEYHFYTDFDLSNQMDSVPFLEIDLFKIKDDQIFELKKFHKSVFDARKIRERASELKYTNEFKKAFAEQLEEPSDDFVKFFLSIASNKRQTQKAIEKSRLLLKKSLHSYINEIMNERIKKAIENNSIETLKDIDIEIEEKNSNIHTTPEELEAFVIVKTLLSGFVDEQNITYKDTGSYLSILYGTKINCWICRLYLNSKTKKYIELNMLDNTNQRIPIEDIYDIKAFKEQLKDIVCRFI